MSPDPNGGFPSQTSLPPGNSVPWEHVERFVGQLSHDIRNGLNACELQLTFIGEVSTEPDAVEDIKRLRATIAGITRQLQAIRVAMSDAKPHRMDYPAKDLFEDLRERFERLSPEQVSRVQWNLEVSETKLVNVDPELVLGSCQELLKNAFQFADRETEVKCLVRERDGVVLASFEEPLSEAPALPPHDWGTSPLVSTRREAYGLGLFRARRALAASGSQLDFHWSPEHKTLTATVTLAGAVTATSS